ncbi:glycosyltransferase [Leptolyngbya sp. 7M]|nr:glycosyltransferase [Leptolyngbya sp. 7M]
MIALTVGNFIDRKGRWTLLDAARRIIKTDGGRNIYFLWLSPMPMSEEDRIRVGSYQLGARFKLIDPATLGSGRTNVLRFFQVADIFVLPSFVEGLPISLLEAMAFGIAPISTRVYGIPEAVEHEKTGLLIEAGDAEALANSMIRLSDEPQLRQRIGENARKIALSKFDERNVARDVVRAYLNAIDR